MTNRLNVISCDVYKDAIDTIKPLSESDRSLETVQNINILSKFFGNILMFSVFLFHLVVYIFGLFKIFITQRCVTIFRTSIYKEHCSKSNSDFQFEDQIENFKNVLEALRIQIVKAEEEYGTITQNIKNIQNQSKLQDDVLDKTINEINRTKDANTSLTLNLNEKNTEIAELKNALQIKEEKLSSAQSKIKFISEKLSAVISPGSNENLEHNELDENYASIVDSIEELKNKMQTQDNIIKKMSLTIQTLDKLNKVNKNINQQNEKMNNLKDGLRRKSDSLVGNLKNITGRLTSSKSVQNIESSGDFQNLNESLTMLVENTESFLEDLSNKYNHLEEQNQNVDEVFEQTFNELWQETSTSTVINGHNVKNNFSSSKRQNLNVNNNNNNFHKIEKPQLLDCGCQTSSNEDSEDVNSLKIMMQSLQRESDELKKRNETLRNKILRYARVTQVLDQTVTDLKLRQKTLFAHEDKNLATITALKNELKNLQNLEKENADLKNIITSKDNELESEKKKFEEVFKFEQDKDKKLIQKLQQALKSLKKKYEEKMNNMNFDLENCTKLLINLKNELNAEKKNSQDLKKRYGKVVKGLMSQMDSQKKSIAILKNKKSELEFVIESFDKKCAWYESDCVKLNEAYRDAFKKKDNEIERLTKEKNGVICTLEQNKLKLKSLLNKYSQNITQTRVVSQKYTIHTSPHVTFRENNQVQKN